MKRKAAFVDHSFHKKTSSSIFIKEILSNDFELVDYYDESWNGGDEINIDLLNKYEYIFYFQIINKVDELKKLTTGKVKIIWFPMWDSVERIKKSQWIRYQIIPMKIICFSKMLYEKLYSLGFDCRYFQYFMDPQSVQAVNDYDIKKVYFWNRTEEINWSIIKKLLGNNSIDSLTFMAVPDPNHFPQIPSKTDLKKYNIHLYNQFLDYETYIDLVSKSNIYIAPRIFEGIGMSFIEALCRGQCVIAPNFSTMNEYIVNGVNGYLYNINRLEEIDITNFNQVGKEARERAINGFKNWQLEKVKLLEYITDFTDITRNSGLNIVIKMMYFKIQEFSYISARRKFKRIIRAIFSKVMNFRK